MRTREGSLSPNMYLSAIQSKNTGPSICMYIISDNYATVQSFIRSDAKHRIRKLKAPQKDSTTHFNHDRYQFCIFHGTFLSLHADLSFQPLVVVFLAGNNQISNAQWQRQHTCWFADDWCVWESTFRLHRAFHGILTEKNRTRPDWDRTQILPHVRDTCKKCWYPDFLGWDTKQYSILKQKETADHLITLPGVWASRTQECFHSHFLIQSANCSFSWQKPKLRMRGRQDMSCVVSCNPWVEHHPYPTKSYHPCKASGLCNNPSRRYIKHCSQRNPLCISLANVVTNFERKTQKRLKAKNKSRKPNSGRKT